MFNTVTQADPQARRKWGQASCGFDAGDDNLRRYVTNDPMNATDPSGLSDKSSQLIRPNGIPEPIWEALIEAWRTSFINREDNSRFMIAAGLGMSAAGQPFSAIVAAEQTVSPYNAVREQGGLIYSDKDGHVTVRPSPPGGVNAFTLDLIPNPTLHETVAGSYHTHPYGDHDNGLVGTSFSSADILANMNGANGDIHYIISGNYVYVMVIVDKVCHNNLRLGRIQKYI